MSSSNYDITYVLDANIFRPLFDYYYPPDLFPEIWNGLEKLDRQGLLTSVRDVKTECENHFKSYPEALAWLNDHATIFQSPTEDELEFLSELLSQNEFKMSKEEIEKGKTKADPLLVAKGKCSGAVVVTAETYRPHGRKIPTMCDRYNVPCIGRIEFIRILREINSRID